MNLGWSFYLYFLFVLSLFFMFLFYLPVFSFMTCPSSYLILQSAYFYITLRYYAVWVFRFFPLFFFFLVFCLEFIVVSSGMVELKGAHTIIAELETHSPFLNIFGQVLWWTLLIKINSVSRKCIYHLNYIWHYLTYLC